MCVEEMTVLLTCYYYLGVVILVVINILIYSFIIVNIIFQVVTVIKCNYRRGEKLL